MELEEICKINGQGHKYKRGLCENHLQKQSQAVYLQDKKETLLILAQKHNVFERAEFLLGDLKAV